MAHDRIIDGAARRTRSPLLFALLLPALLPVGCRDVTATGPASGPVAAAVAERRLDQVERLLDGGASPDDRDDRGDAALIVAAETDQFRIANLLIERGADMWTATELGFTPALFAQTTHLPPDSAEGIACRTFVATLRERGYPWPPPRQDQVVALRSAGRWPPVAGSRTR